MTKSTNKVVIFLGKKYSHAKKFKSEHPILCICLVIILMASKLYFFPSISLAAPTNLNKFPKKTKRGICRRVCKRGYTLCDSCWKLYRGKKNSRPICRMCCTNSYIPSRMVNGFLRILFGRGA